MLSPSWDTAHRDARPFNKLYKYITLPYDFLTLLAIDFQLKLYTKEISNPFSALPDTDYLIFRKERANLANMNIVYQEQDEIMKHNKALRGDSADTRGELGMINDMKTVRKLYACGEILESFTA